MMPTNQVNPVNQNQKIVEEKSKADKELDKNL